MRRTANYSAFYVSEPFNDSNLGANATKDFVYYNQLRAWKAADGSFPFNDAHGKTYNVRDDSLWDTLKARLHERLDLFKNIILFLSSNTKNSRALREEIDYGVNVKGLPLIIIYPEFSEKSDIVSSSGEFRKQVVDLWNNVPLLRDSMANVASLHIPYKKSLIRAALCNSDFTVQNMGDVGKYHYPVD